MRLASRERSHRLIAHNPVDDKGYALWVIIGKGQIYPPKLHCTARGISTVEVAPLLFDKSPFDQIIARIAHP